MLLPGTGYSSSTNSSFSAVSLNMWALIHIRVFLHKVIMFFYQFLKKKFTFTLFFSIHVRYIHYATVFFIYEKWSYIVCIRYLILIEINLNKHNCLLEEEKGVYYYLSLAIFSFYNVLWSSLLPGSLFIFLSSLLTHLLYISFMWWDGWLSRMGWVAKSGDGWLSRWDGWLSRGMGG
jgi:hypothetical protein